MPSKANPAKAESDVAESEAEPPLPLEHALDALASRCLAYAARARIVRFRYCPRPSLESQGSIEQALSELEDELAYAENHPVCQSLAFELLAHFAHLAQRPPCSSSRQQKAVAKIVHNALLDLR